MTARGWEVQEAESWEESEADVEQDGTGMEGGGAAPDEDGNIVANGTEREDTDAPRVAELRNNEADDEERLETAWLEERERERLEAAWLEGRESSERMEEPSSRQSMRSNWSENGLWMRTRRAGTHLGMGEERDVGIGLSLRCVLEAKTLL